MKKILTIIALILFISVPVVAQEIDYCEGDFDYDGDCDGTDASVFKLDFGRSQYSNPCPSQNLLRSLVPKTGQNICYNESGTEISCADTGHDGDLQKGISWPNPRFTDNLDGTITDNLTGLIWLKNANCIATNYPEFDNDNYTGDGRVTWQHALDFVAGINDEIYPNCSLDNTDWRLPNVRELFSLTHDAYYNLALPNTTGTGQWSEGDPFNYVQSSFYWSSTTRVDETGEAVGVDMYAGNSINRVKTNSIDNCYVWPVRGGQ